jgi:hypothetical protein
MFSRDPITNLENFDKQRVHWGYFLGFNMYDFKIDYTDTPDVDIESSTVTGLCRIGRKPAFARIHRFAF